MILDSIVASTLRRVKSAKDILSPSQIKAFAMELDCKTGFPFEERLKRKGINFICEIKRASPSKGLIATEFPYLKIAKEYENADAAAISVLTEPEFFLGSNKYLKEISSAVSIPCLRKDFILDEYQIYESKILGASAVLLICSLLETDTLKRFIKLCDTLGLSALVEVHDENELYSASYADARIIGANNRDLKDFTVDFENSIRLHQIAPIETLFVAESGIKTADDVAVLWKHGINAVLIGETLMCSKNRIETLNELRGVTL